MNIWTMNAEDVVISETCNVIQLRLTGQGEQGMLTAEILHLYIYTYIYILLLLNNVKCDLKFICHYSLSFKIETNR